MATTFRDLFPLTDRIRYIFWRLTRQHSEFRGRIQGGPWVSIRPRPQRDYDTAYEMFLCRVYDNDLPAASVKRIVDLGGNVGYSCLFWCSTYPDANVITFEPHPINCELLDARVRDNGFAERVKLVRAAAAAGVGRASLADDEDASTVVKTGSKDAFGRSLIDIEQLDVFETVGDAPVDIFKMDIEGAEYEIMSDSRFDELMKRTRLIILEWHNREPHHKGARWCQDRLEGLGFRVTAGDSAPENGILFGKR